MAELKSASLSIDHRDACVILGALRDQYLKDLGVVHLLRVAQGRDLTRAERFMLPETLKMLSREELAEQYDSWISLCDTTLWIVQQTESLHLNTMPPSLAKRRAAGEIL
jgi:hypothetical protein